MRMEAIGTSCYFAECPLVAEGVEEVRSEPSPGVRFKKDAMKPKEAASSSFDWFNRDQKERCPMSVSSPTTSSEQTLYAALELSKNSWLLTIQLPDRDNPSLHPIKRGDREMPSWAGFDFYDFKGWHGVIAVQEAVTEPFDLRCRLIELHRGLPRLLLGDVPVTGRRSPAPRAVLPSVRGRPTGVSHRFGNF